MKNSLPILLIFLVAASFSFGQATDPEKILNAAIYEEEVNGNLEAAMQLYNDIIKNYPNDRAIVAEALYRNGITNEKLGNQKATEYYEMVIKNYPEQSEIVHLARIRLNNILKENPASPASAVTAGLSVIKLYDEDADMRKGTRLDLSSLSPDGTKLVGIHFLVGQNVATYEIDSKEIELITDYDWTSEGSGWAYFPTWSPDSEKIAYLFAPFEDPGDMQYHLKITGLDGGSSTLVRNEPNAGQIIPRQWSLDGESILTFIQDTTGYYTISLVSADDGSIKRIHKTQWQGQIPEGDASLSPDGKYIAFADGPEDQMDIFIMFVEGGTPVEVSGYPTNEREPLWSPDGENIVFIRELKGESLLYTQKISDGEPDGSPLLVKEGMQNIDLMNWTENGISYNMMLDIHDIYTLNIDPETAAPEDKPRPLNFTPTGSNIIPVWSHDGQYLAFVSYADQPKVVVIPANEDKPRYYSIHAPGFWELSLWDLRWLPDDSGIGFTVVTPNDEIRTHVVDLASGEWRYWNLPVPGWTRAEWGPDNNSQIISVNGLKPLLYKYNKTTGDTLKFFQSEDTTWLTIRAMKSSRDHKNVAFMTGEKGIMLVDCETGEHKRISEEGWHPTFSPDGKKILTFGIYEEEGKKYKGIVLFSIEGEMLHRYDLAHHFESGTRINAPDWSPKGNKLAFMTRNIVDETALLKNVLK
jgi:Tol biopolymer transport system component